MNEHVFAYNCDMTENVESDAQRKFRLTKALQRAEAELGLARISRDRHRMVAASAQYKKALSAYEADPQLGKNSRNAPTPT